MNGLTLREKDYEKNNKFFKYVSQNIFAMIGMSCYIIADTFLYQEQRELTE